MPLSASLNRRQFLLRATALPAVAPAVETILLSDEESAPLQRFYLEELLPYLEEPRRRGQRLGDAGKARLAFAGLKTLLPVVGDAALQDLEDICDEARQLVRQERLHRWLHGWLLLHIPISLALVVLGMVHAIVALQY